MKTQPAYYCLIHVSKIQDEIIFNPMYEDHLGGLEYINEFVTLPYNISPGPLGQVSKATLLTKTPQILKGIDEMNYINLEALEIPDGKQTHSGLSELRIPQYLASKANNTKQFSEEYTRFSLFATERTIKIESRPIFYYGLDDYENRSDDSMFVGSEIPIMCKNEELGRLIFLIYNCCQRLMSNELQGI